MRVVHDRCFICGAKSDFCLEEGITLFREARCNICGASLRNSDTAKAVIEVILGKTASLSECVGELSGINILEAQAVGPIYNLLKKLPRYVCFEYFDDVKPGEYKNGILCNDLENLTFGDSSFDLVITQDVFEHVANPGKAFFEIYRVLREGGYHIFTVPLHEGRPTKSRRGLPEVYHGDPLRKQGILVYTDWGDDICSLVDKYGFETLRIDAHIFYQPHEITDVDQSYSEYLVTPPLKYYRYNSIVFISQKRGNRVKRMINLLKVE
ncbi:class I SAM-dependent methyltransferase [Desulfofundulus thermobenzoicus]|uniref:class I SAM-dependent methyltransferase n=1 Tax=Desulfofundulus thermobenzoicus TaxID=29376 RepID=UPI00128F1C0F|nr:class I SAM-dependent methyltransferase [Desulfofundulus thermobenzoicus]